MPTYYTTHNAGGGGVGRVAAPWTLQEAADQAVAGDEVRICNTGTYTPAATIDFDTNSGTHDAPIQFLGYDSAGTSREQALVQVSTNDTTIFSIVSRA